MLYDLVRKAWPGDWVVLKRAERHLARGSDAGQLTEVRRRLVLLDQGVDRIRTQHYRSRLSDMNPSLARLGYDVHFDMVLVPAGRFKFGAEKPGPGERRYATRKTAAFWIDRYEVTNRQYLRFVRATKRRPPDYLTRNLPDERLDHPVSRVSLADAQSYSRWVGKRLPTELEWEKAARGSLYRRYPYGKHFWGKAANTAEARKGGPVSVGSYPLGRSPYGLFDMCGNVCEWTTTLFNPQAPVPNRVAKGGSYLSDRNQCRVATRKRVNPTDGAVDVGFRCCTDR